MNKIAKYLNQHLVGNVYTRSILLDAVSHDHSILKITPRYLAIPANIPDLQKLVRSAHLLAQKNLHLPLTPRGTGLDKTGAALTSELTVSTAKLNSILEIDSQSRLVRVQAGVTLGQLNSALALHGLTLPIQSDPRHTIGGLINNYAFHKPQAKYGDLYHYVERLEFITSSGDIVQTARYHRRATKRHQNLVNFEGKLYRGLDQILARHAQTIQKINLKNLDATGYKMISQVRHGRTFDLMPLIFSSQGTLGIVTEVILSCEPLPDFTRRLAIAFATADEIPNFIKQILKFKPTDIQLLDHQIFQTSATEGKSLEFFSTAPGYLLLLRFDGSYFSLRHHLRRCQKLAPAHSQTLIEAPDNKDLFDSVEAALLSLLNQSLPTERPPLLDDVRIPLAHLPNFLEHLLNFSDELGLDLPVFGSVLQNNYSVRPAFHLNTVAGRKFALRFLREYAALVATNHGSITGGSPEGRIKGIITNPTLTAQELALYQEIKDLFDPHHIFNPEAKLGATLPQVIRSLRTIQTPELNTK